MIYILKKYNYQRQKLSTWAQCLYLKYTLAMKRTAKFIPLCSTHMVFEQKGMFIVPQLLRYWSSDRICFFIWVFHPTRGLFSHIESSEGMQIKTFTKLSMAFGNEASLACHPYYYTGRPFITVISEYPWHSHLWSSV